ncbi:MAG: hypothetical protein HY747_04805 [Elusimicrobia bacterium]|nr:hypothetical protein [Elusimicrobiota bacterium]
MRFIKLAVLFGACLIVSSCQKKPKENLESERPVYTIENWKKEILKENYSPAWGETSGPWMANENPPEGIHILTEVQPSTHPYFILYGNFNNNGKPDALFIETYSSSMPAFHFSDFGPNSENLDARRLYLYEWDGKYWIKLLSIDSMGIYNTKRHLAHPQKLYRLGRATNCYAIGFGAGHPKFLEKSPKLTAPSKPLDAEDEKSFIPNHCAEIQFSDFGPGGRDTAYLYWSKSNVYLLDIAQIGKPWVSEANHNTSDNCFIEMERKNP